jgi:uncharacterized protein YjeT (DUF2065 family)
MSESRGHGRHRSPDKRGSGVETFAVQVFPVAQPEEWDAFIQETSSGPRAEGHREMLRGLGVTREHVYRQDTPAGAIMVLVWEGIHQSEVPERMRKMIENPKTDHERHIVGHVIPVILGVDPTAGPPPEMRKVATTET